MICDIAIVLSTQLHWTDTGIHSSRYTDSHINTNEPIHSSYSCLVC